MFIHQKPSWRDFRNFEMYVISQATAYPGAQNGARRPHMRTTHSFCGLRSAYNPCPACSTCLICSPCSALGPCSVLSPHPARSRCSTCIPNSARSGAPPAVLAPLQPPLCSRQALSARCHPASQVRPRAPFSSIRPAWSRRFLHGCARYSRSRRDTERWRLCCGPGR